MKILVVYDSVFGNTEKIAQEIGDSLSYGNETRTVRVGDTGDESLDEVDLLIVGSPTRKFRPTPAVVGFLKRLPADRLNGLSTAAFDTRVNLERIKSPIFRFIVDRAGYAANAIAKQLERSGARLLGGPEGFLVQDTEGPLKEGEVERAAGWAKRLQEHRALP